MRCFYIILLIVIILSKRNIHVLIMKKKQQLHDRMELVANTMVVIVLQLINVSFTRCMYNNLKKGEKYAKVPVKP